MASMGGAHLIVACSNAGRIPAMQQTPQCKLAGREHGSTRRCPFCPGQPWKPRRAHHCRTCDCCIFRRHHHCIVIGNCVGWGNQKLFWVFLLYSMLALILSLGLLMFGVASHLSILYHGASDNRRPLRGLVCCAWAPIVSSAGL